MSFMIGTIALLALDANIAELNRFVRVTEQVQKAAELRGAKWGFHNLYLLNDPNVASTLGLNQKQQSKLQELTKQYVDRTVSLIRERERRQTARDTSDTTAKEFERRRQQLDKLYAGKATDFLSEQQRSRLIQIKLQLRSVDIFFYREILDQLKLSDQQMQKLEQYRHEIARQTQGWRLKRNKHDVTSVEATKAIDAILDLHRKRIVDLFSQEQRDIYERLTGSKIKFRRSDLQITLRR